MRTLLRGRSGGFDLEHNRGYWHINVKMIERTNTSFTLRNSLSSFVHMPFGLKTPQRVPSCHFFHTILLQTAVRARVLWQNCVVFTITVSTYRAGKACSSLFKILRGHSEAPEMGSLLKQDRRQRSCDPPKCTWRLHLHSRRDYPPRGKGETIGATVSDRSV